MLRKNKNTPAPIRFDEAEFARQYRQRAAPSSALVAAFHKAASGDDSMALGVLNRVRADAATGPGGILTMFAVALAVVGSMTTTALTVTEGSAPEHWRVVFGTVMVGTAAGFTVLGVWLYVRQSSRHRCANMWKDALEHAPRPTRR
ncbi:hypothetical protein GCM10017714_13470 [Curtobacterium pusillum]|uniref:Uncharacterized protein n=1 Tax=Curtobacterium pusillum TaxID=69373 RepID=A0ABX2M886_9MICO|nr:hypothetical protein [Curtobacterium pusillum]NUU13115.1 hypothetical protein [Curtobacterium pusillum]GLK30608.1 hypothetical protein GCM10017610_08930 [Curtobacterium pusillum]